MDLPKYFARLSIIKTFQAGDLEHNVLIMYQS